jgi:hypothetical protein
VMEVSSPPQLPKHRATSDIPSAPRRRVLMDAALFFANRCR